MELILVRYCRGTTKLGVLGSPGALEHFIQTVWTALQVEQLHLLRKPWFTSHIIDSKTPSLNMAKLICVLASVLGVCSAVCTIKGQRRAWHTFSNTEKLAYIDAEMCLMRKPATIGLPGTKSRFDEFQAMHQLQAYAIHYVVSKIPGDLGSLS